MNLEFIVNPKRDLATNPKSSGRSFAHLPSGFTQDDNAHRNAAYGGVKRNAETRSVLVA